MAYYSCQFRFGAGRKMQGNKKVIRGLNGVLKHQLTAVNQYFLHARIYKNFGFGGLDEHAYRQSISRMKQADRLIERILLLEGLPNLQDLGALTVGEDPEEMLNADLKLESAAVAFLKEVIGLCEAGQDYVSRDLLAAALADQEEYVDWLETQFALISRIGMDNYLQSRISRPRAGLDETDITNP